MEIKNFVYLHCSSVRSCHYTFFVLLRFQADSKWHETLNTYIVCAIPKSKAINQIGYWLLDNYLQIKLVKNSKMNFIEEVSINCVNEKFI